MNSNSLRKAILVAATWTLSSFASATTSYDYSDLWSTKNEAGWGLNLSQQSNVVFATLFVYNNGGLAFWYSATLNLDSAGKNGAASYSGLLYQTSGTSIGKPYNPADLQYKQVGKMTINFGDDATGVLSYTVDGVSVVKDISRLTFAAQSVAGDYLGATQDITFSCTNPQFDNRVTTDQGAIKITQTGSDLKIETPTCTYTGTYTQQGQVGRAVGTYACTHGGTGEVTFTGLRGQKGGMTGEYFGTDFFCDFRGNIGAMRNLN